MQRRLIAVALLAMAGFLLMEVSVRQAVLLLVGAGMGAALAGTRFGFTTGWRHLIERKDPQGVGAQLLLLALASSAALPLLAAFPELKAALGPPSVSLLLGAFVFGLSMQIADGCGSGTLYKAGLGLPLNMGILPLFALGSFLGSAQLNQWLALGQMSPVDLSARLGPGAAWALTLVLLAGLALGVRLWVGPGKTWFTRRWVIGALVLAGLATLNLLLAGQPWGVVYGFGLWAAKLATAAQLFDPAANAFWQQDHHRQILQQSVLLDVTSITNIGILAGALWISARARGREAGAATHEQPLTAVQWSVGLLAGFVMGYSSRLAFGCNIGALLGGISTGSLHGWLWVPAAFAGSLIGVRVRRRLAYG
jgi:uncharacterized membrane protein YedE/YeeE